MSEGKIGDPGQEQEKELSPEVKAWIEKIKALQVRIGHEINNPLTPIFGELHFWKQERPDLSDSIAEIEDKAKEISNLVAKVTQALVQIQEEKDYREHFLAIRDYFIPPIKTHTQTLIALLVKMPDESKRKGVILEQATRILGVCEQFSGLELEHLELKDYSEDLKMVDLEASLEAAAKRAKGEENKEVE